MGPEFRAQRVLRLCSTMSGPQLGDSMAVGWKHLEAFPLPCLEPGLGCCADVTTEASLCGSASAQHGGFRVIRIFTWQFLALRACVLENTVKVALPFRVQPLKSCESHLLCSIGWRNPRPIYIRGDGTQTLPLHGNSAKEFRSHVLKPPNFLSWLYLWGSFALTSWGFCLSVVWVPVWVARGEEYLLRLMMSSPKYFIHTMSPFHWLKAWMFWNSKSQKEAERTLCLLLSHFFPGIEVLQINPSTTWRQGVGEAPKG